jgi:SNF2 family DNA or RNA helicase
MRGKLHEYQKSCVRFLVKRPFAGLFLDMGLGKTLIVLTALKALFAERKVKRVLVLATKRIAEEVWSREIEKWGFNFSYVIATGKPKDRLKAIKRGAQITIINYENFIWLAELFNGAGAWGYDFVIVDESSAFKNPQAQRFKALRSIRPFLKRLIILTGTPAPNGLIDLWSQIFLLDQGERLGQYITRYRNTYFTPAAGSGFIVYSWRIRQGADKVIYDKISDLCISMRSRDYLKLPDRTDNFIRLSLSEKHQKAYRVFEREAVLKLSSCDITAVNAAVLTGKLLQFASGAVYDETGAYFQTHDTKVQGLKELYDESQGQPLLVFYQFRSDKERLLRVFTDARTLDTCDVSDWNKGRIPMLLVHPRSAGHGLNLQYGGHIIVWFSMLWSLEQYQQSNARLLRQGQQHPVTVHHLVCKGTVDERAVRVLQGKEKGQTALLEALKESVKAGQSGQKGDKTA